MEFYRGCLSSIKLEKTEQMNSTINLFSPVKLGFYTLPNRIVMAPMTRLRAVGSLSNSLMATYYAQRASAGLLVTECTMVSPLSNGYINNAVHAFELFFVEFL